MTRRDHRRLARKHAREVRAFARWARRIERLNRAEGRAL